MVVFLCVVVGGRSGGVGVEDLRDVCAISATSSSVVTKGGPDLQRVVVDGADQHAGMHASPTESPGLITTSRLPD